MTVPDDTNPDLGYTDIAALERLARGMPRTEGNAAAGSGDTAEPDWSAVRDRCEVLRARTRDLRVHVWQTRAALSLNGLPGLATGLQDIADALESSWPALHPRVADDDPSAQERRNLLANLSPDATRSHPSQESESLRRAWRGLDLGPGPGAERLTLRDLERGAPVPAALHPQHIATAETAHRALRALLRIDAVFVARTGSGCRLEALQDGLERVRRAIVPALAPDSATTSAMTDAEAVVSAPRPEAWSRAEAVRRLSALSAWVRDAEPSSPAPLFIDRAVTLLQMDFGGIVRALMPESRAQIERLGVAPLEPAGPH